MAQELKTDLVSPATGASPLPRMTFEEFLDWYDEETPAEWVDGEVILMSPVSTKHQLLADFLSALLRFFVEVNNRGLVLSAPFLMKLALRPSGREPDVIFIARERLGDLKNVYLDGPADLAIEIISPESRTRDRRDKYQEYQQAGVREYWLLDPIRKEAEFYHLSEQGSFTLIDVGTDRIFRSEVLDGLWLNVDWLWQEPLPPLMFILKEWGLVRE
jgi:Uma2 family endonuclease